ncbi:hypothetical protein [Peribacillus frigoritolerans]|uniref:hypothetical protein n=1 Tax=Peribacillus frigoritolerans TaxID=450367 RepID=UPI0025A0D8D8|nr:hypothetical protein [Peribacillus frigoritolerans]MDM5313377.1 hypothetical protein [Peribacillus frigoritolerans]
MLVTGLTLFDWLREDKFYYRERCRMTQQTNKEVITFKTKDKVTVNIHGKPNFDMWAKKMIELYNSMQNKSAS